MRISRWTVLEKGSRHLNPKHEILDLFEQALDEPHSESSNVISHQASGILTRFLHEISVLQLPVLRSEAVVFTAS